MDGRSPDDDPAFRWTDQAWPGRQLPGSVLYELHVGTFTPEGTPGAAIQRLDHLVDLGVDLVELLPLRRFHGLRRFVNACHARGLAVALDIVHDHVDPYAGGAHRAVVESILGCLRDYHLDALRIDTIDGLPDSLAGSTMTPLLADLAVGVEMLSAHLGRPLSLIAGSDVDTARLVVPRGVAVAHPSPVDGGPREYGDFGSLKRLITVLVRRFAADPQTSGPSDGRTTATISPKLRRIAATLLFTAPFVPVVMMGEEWAASRHVPLPERAPMLAAAVRRADPAPYGGWEPSTATWQSEARPPLDWSELGERQHREMFDFYRRLIALRRQHPHLAAPCQQPIDVRHGDHFLAVRRGACVVVANLGRTPQRVNVYGLPRRVLLATELGVTLTHDAVDLPAESAAVVACSRFHRR